VSDDVWQNHIDWGAWLWTEASGFEYLGQGIMTDMTPDGSVVVGWFASSSPLDGHNFRSPDIGHDFPAVLGDSLR
jgi:hypothetical protein